MHGEVNAEHEHEQVCHACVQCAPEQVNFKVNTEGWQNTFREHRARERDEDHQQEESRIPDLIEACFAWQFLEQP